MADPKSGANPMATAEKLATQAETGEGRSTARPGGSAGIGSGLQPGSTSPNNAPLGGDMGPLGGRGGTGGAGSLSGNVTNDSMPDGGATGDLAQPDTIKPGTTKAGTTK